MQTYMSKNAVNCNSVTVELPTRSIFCVIIGRALETGQYANATMAERGRGVRVASGVHELHIPVRTGGIFYFP